MADFRDVEALCIRLRISQTQALDALQLERAPVISDHCTKLEDIADADVPYAIAFLRGRFAPNELFL